MTDPIDAPFPTPGTTTTSGAMSPSTTTTIAATTTTATAEPNTTDVAKEEAKNVGQTAAQAGSQVASTAADQAKQVAQETQRQAKDLLNQGRMQLKDQAMSQQQKATRGLSSLAQELRGLADGSSQGAPGPARDLLQQASGMVEDFASKLQNREPAELLEEIRNFARRKPGMFLFGAAAAGLLAGRLTSGVKAAHSDQPSSGTRGMQYANSSYADPAPSVAGYTTTSGSAPLPPPPYGTEPPAGSVVPPTTPAGWDDPTRRTGEGGG